MGPHHDPPLLVSLDTLKLTSQPACWSAPELQHLKQCKKIKFNQLTSLESYIMLDMFHKYQKTAKKKKNHKATVFCSH